MDRVVQFEVFIKFCVFNCLAIKAAEAGVSLNRLAISKIEPVVYLSSKSVVAATLANTLTLTSTEKIQEL